MSEGSDLRRRALEGIVAEVRAFGAGAPGSELIERDGLVASVCPATPDRSLFNSVYYDGAGVLRSHLDELAEAYDRAGVRAWTVWVPDDDRGIAELLEQRGHVLDAAPRLMALELDAMPPVPACPDGVEVGPLEAAAAASLNDRAYGYRGAAFGVALAATDPAVRWLGAFRDGEPISCVAAIDVGDDCGITCVATDAAERGRGLAGHLVAQSLVTARDARGCRTGSLQATRDGAPVYERIGFRDFGCAQMWEHRIPEPDTAD